MRRGAIIPWALLLLISGAPAHAAEIKVLSAGAMRAW